MKHKKIEFIQMKLNCCETSICKAYPYGSIPNKLLIKACISVDQIYGHKVHRDDILGMMIDLSIIGYEKIKVFFTEKGIFYKDRKNMRYILYKTIKKNNCIPDAIYVDCNQSEMKTLIDGLIKIDEQEEWINLAGTVKENIDNINETIDSLGETIDVIKETGARIIDFFKTCKNK